MGLLVNTPKAIPSTALPSRETPAQQALPEDIWKALLPSQREAVFQTIAQGCRQLAQRRKKSEEGNND
jgi:hypothetical protein